MGYDGDQVTLSFEKAGLFYPKNPLLAPPNGMKDIRNCVVYNGGLEPRGGTAFLEPYISGFASGNGGFEEGAFSPGWTQNNSEMSSYTINEDCSSLSGYTVSTNPPYNVAEVNPVGQYHLNRYSIGPPPTTPTISKDFGSIANEYTFEISMKFSIDSFHNIPMISVGSAVHRLMMQFNYTGLYIQDATASNGYHPAFTQFFDDAFHTWKFVVTSNGELVDVYVDDVLMLSGESCDQTPDVNGEVEFTISSSSSLDWYIDWFRVTDPVRSGSYSCKLDTSVGSSGAKSDAFLVDVSILYQVQVYYYVVDYTSGNAKLKVHFYSDTAGTSLISSSDIFSATAATSGWTSGFNTIGPGGVLSFPTGTLSIRLQQVWESTPSGVFYIDDVSIPSNASRITGLKQFRMKNGNNFLMRAYSNGVVGQSPTSQLQTGWDYLGDQCLAQTDFSASSAWTLGGLWSVAAGKATFSGLGISDLSQLLAQQVKQMQPNADYEFFYTISNKTVAAGTLTAQLIGDSCSSVWVDLDITNGTHSVRFTTSNSLIGFSMQGASTDAGNSFEIDDVYVKEIAAYPVDFEVFKENVVAANGRNAPIIWNGADTLARPVGGVEGTDISFDADDKLGGYGLTDEASSVDGNAALGQDHIDKSHTLSAGTVRFVKLYFETQPPPEKRIKIKVWRQNGANLDLVGSTDYIPVGGFTIGLHLITLPSTITAQAGDFPGVFLEKTNDTQISISAKDGAGISRYKAGDNTTSAESGWTTGTKEICFEFYSGNILSVTTDFVSAGFADGYKVKIVGSSSNNRTLILDGTPQTTAMHVVDPSMMSNESAGATIQLFYGNATDWTGSYQPKYFITHGVNNAVSLWAFGVSNKLGMVYKASPGTENFSEDVSWWANIDTGDAFGIVGAVEYGRRLLFFSHNNTYIIEDTSTTETDWYYYKALWKGGAAHKQLIVNVENDVHIMARDGTIYMLSAVQEYGDYKMASISHPYWIDRWMRDNIDFTYIDDFRVAYDPTPGKKAVYWSMVRKGQTQTDTALVYYIEDKVWQIHDNRTYASGFNASSITTYHNDDGSYYIVSGDYIGRTWKLNQTSYNDESNGYYSGVTLHATNFGNSSIEKHYDYFRVTQTVLGDYNMSVGVEIGDAEYIPSLTTFSTSEKYQSVELGEQGFDISLSISNSNANEYFFLQELIIYYQNLGVQI